MAFRFVSNLRSQIWQNASSFTAFLPNVRQKQILLPSQPACYTNTPTSLLKGQLEQDLLQIFCVLQIPPALAPSDKGKLLSVSQNQPGNSPLPAPFTHPSQPLLPRPCKAVPFTGLDKGISLTLLWCQSQSCEK